MGWYGGTVMVLPLLTLLPNSPGSVDLLPGN